MKIRIFVYFSLFMAFLFCAGFATKACADPAEDFWSMYVGNWWEYDGSGGGDTWTWKNEIQSSDTTAIPGVKTYYMRGLKDGYYYGDYSRYQISAK